MAQLSHKVIAEYSRLFCQYDRLQSGKISATDAVIIYMQVEEKACLLDLHYVRKFGHERAVLDRFGLG